jgi:hypothetical protein
MNKFFLRIPFYYAVAGAAGSFSILRGLGFRTSHDLHGFSPLWIVGIATIIILIWQCAALKQRLLAVVPREIQFVEASPEQFPMLDVAGFNFHTSELEALGFVKYFEYSTTSNATKTTNGIARLFAHPEQHCFAELNQAFAKGKAAMPVGIVLLSWLSNDFPVSTTNRQMSGISYAIRRCHGSVVSMVNAKASELFEVHLHHRLELAHQMGAQISTDVSSEVYFQYQAQAQYDRRNRLEKLNPIVFLATVDLYNLKPKKEWYDFNKSSSASV